MHEHVDDRHLVERGLVNYWGYNTLGFFAPSRRMRRSTLPADVVREFKTMVRNLHAADIEVILDVVYNHTAEGNHLGPTLSFRGIDNASYYRLSPEDPRYYMDFTGCGNTLNMRNPRVLQFIMDSLRYWIMHMHVDGFRFDLASTLARELHEVDKLGAFFDIIHQDPVISQVKLIAEPWDLGDGGYQVGNFPVLWSEWNGKYRDCIRRFWKGDGGVVSEFATRFCGSSDLYEWSSRRPHASINFITAHDGFTLNDLVSYDHKHNEANGENNRDGADDNISWNCGVEGPTDDPKIEELRERKKRSLLATLLLSQGVPMLLAGDEIGHTQHGNNNAYCQDNEISWINWKLEPDQESLLRVHAQRDRALPRATGVSSTPFLPRPRHSGCGGAGNRLARSVGQGNGARGLEHRLCALPGRQAHGRRHRRRRARRIDSRRHDHHAFQRRPREHDSLRVARPRPRRSLGAGVRHRAGKQSQRPRRESRQQLSVAAVLGGGAGFARSEGRVSSDVGRIQLHERSRTSAAVHK